MRALRFYISVVVAQQHLFAQNCLESFLLFFSFVKLGIFINTGCVAKSAGLVLHEATAQFCGEPNSNDVVIAFAAT